MRKKVIFFIFFIIILSCGKDEVEIGGGTYVPPPSEHGLIFYFAVSNKFPMERVWIDTEIPEDYFCDYPAENKKLLRELFYKRGRYFRCLNYPERRGILSNNNFVAVLSNSILKIEGNNTNLITNVNIFASEYIVSANEKYFVKKKLVDNYISIMEIYRIIDMEKIYIFTNKFSFELNLWPEGELPPILSPVETPYGYIDGDVVLGNEDSDLAGIIKDDGKGNRELFILNLSNIELISVVKPTNYYFSNYNLTLLPIGINLFSPKNRYLIYSISINRCNYINLKRDLKMTVGQPFLYDTVGKTNITLVSYSILENFYSPPDFLPEYLYCIDNNLKNFYIFFRGELVLGGYIDSENIKRSDLIGLWRMDISSLGLSE